MVSLTKILNECVLIFTGSHVADEGIIKLSECLKSNTSLRRLDLGGKSNQNLGLIVQLTE
jgi:hypothetical protein